MLGVQIYGRINYQEIGPYSPGDAGPRRWLHGQQSQRAGPISPSQSAISAWGWGLHTVRGSIDLGDHCFRPRVVGVVYVSNNSNSAMRPYPSCWAGPRRWPNGKLSQGDGSMSPSQKQIHWMWVFHTVRGGIDPGDHFFRPRVVKLYA